MDEEATQLLDDDFGLDEEPAEELAHLYVVCGLAPPDSPHSLVISSSLAACVVLVQRTQNKTHFLCTFEQALGERMCKGGCLHIYTQTFIGGQEDT